MHLLSLNTFLKIAEFKRFLLFTKSDKIAVNDTRIFGSSNWKFYEEKKLQKR